MFRVQRHWVISAVHVVNHTHTRTVAGFFQNIMGSMCEWGNYKVSVTKIMLYGSFASHLKPLPVESVFEVDTWSKTQTRTSSIGTDRPAVLWVATEGLRWYWCLLLWLNHRTTSWRHRVTWNTTPPRPPPTKFTVRSFLSSSRLAFVNTLWPVFLPTRQQGALHCLSESHTLVCPCGIGWNSQLFFCLFGD